MPRPTPVRRVAYHIACGCPCVLMQELESLTHRGCDGEEVTPLRTYCYEDPRPVIVARRRRCQPPRRKPILPTDHLGVSHEPMECQTTYKMSYQNACDAQPERVRSRSHCRPATKCIIYKNPHREDRDPPCTCERGCPCHDLMRSFSWEDLQAARPCEPCQPRSSRPPCGKRQPILPRHQLPPPSGHFATRDQTTHNMSYQPWLCEELYYCY